jgi:hypothetical protein
MEKQDFTCHITVDVTTKKAAEAITSVSRWWAQHVEGDTQNLNSIFTVRFGETSGTFKIVEVIPNKRMLWDVVDCYLPIFKNVKDWKGTKLRWDISTEGQSTRITFAHIGLVPGKECYQDCIGGWSFYIKESLFKLIAEGKGLPGIGIRCTISPGERTYKGTLFFKRDPLPDLPEEYILIDVKELRGEHVVSAYAVERLDKANFSGDHMRGAYYMLVEDKPHFGIIDPLKDISETIEQPQR